MNIHLIRTGNVDDITYTGVYEFLKQTSGPYTFYIQDVPEEIDELDEVKIVELGDDRLVYDEDFVDECSLASCMIFLDCCCCVGVSCSFSCCSCSCVAIWPDAACCCCCLPAVAA